MDVSPTAAEALAGRRGWRGGALKPGDRLYARLTAHRRAVEQAQHIIARALSTASPWAVAFSGGKDSTVLLHLVREQAPDTLAVFVDSGAEYPETLEFIAATANVAVLQPGMSILDMYRETGMFGAEARRPGMHWRRGIITETLIKAPLAWYASEYGYAGTFSGLRAEESAKRKTMSRYQPAIWRQKDGLYRSEPLMQFALADVWAYIAAHDLAYNACYDVLEGMGVPRAQQRVASYAGGSVIGWGRWAILARGWPELFNRFAAEFPQVRGYT